MQTVVIIPRSIFAHRCEIDGSIRASITIYYRRRSDAEVRLNVRATEAIRGRFARFKKHNVPQHGPRIRIAGIDRVTCSRNVEHVVHAHSRNRKTRNVERLCVDLSIHIDREELTELVKINVRRGENCFVQILARSRQIVVPGQNVGCGRWRRCRGWRWSRGRFWGWSRRRCWGLSGCRG
jgi:hypothetical protein